MNQSVKTTLEPSEAFPYTPPTDEIKAENAHFFTLKEPLPPRIVKVLFGRVLFLF